jgi:hypothetical protein
MSITIETVKLPERGRVNFNLNFVADIRLTADEARRKVSVFTGNQIADLLSGETPNLIWQTNGVYWRVPVALSSRTWGRIGVVGAIDVDVQTGELQLNEAIIEEIEANAQRFAAAAAL